MEAWRWVVTCIILTWLLMAPVVAKPLFGISLREEGGWFWAFVYWWSLPVKILKGKRIYRFDGRPVRARKL